MYFSTKTPILCDSRGSLNVREYFEHSTVTQKATSLTTYAADEAADGYSLMDCLPNSALLTEESVEIGDFDSASMAQFNNSECEDISRSVSRSRYPPHSALLNTSGSIYRQRFTCRSPYVLHQQPCIDDGFSDSHSLSMAYSPTADVTHASTIYDDMISQPVYRCDQAMRLPAAYTCQSPLLISQEGYSHSYAVGTPTPSTNKGCSSVTAVPSSMVWNARSQFTCKSPFLLEKFGDGPETNPIRHITTPQILFSELSRMRFRSSEMIYLDSNSMRVIGGHIEQYNDNLQSHDAQHKDYSSTEASDMTCSPVSNSSALSNSSHHYSSQTRINLEMNGLEADSTDSEAEKRSQRIGEHLLKQASPHMAEYLNSVDGKSLEITQDKDNAVSSAVVEHDHCIVPSQPSGNVYTLPTPQLTEGDVYTLPAPELTEADLSTVCDPVHTHELPTVCDPIHTDELPTIHTDMAVATETGAIILNEIMDMQLMLDEAEDKRSGVENSETDRGNDCLAHVVAAETDSPCDTLSPADSCDDDADGEEYLDDREEGRAMNTGDRRRGRYKGRLYSSSSTQDLTEHASLLISSSDHANSFRKSVRPILHKPTEYISHISQPSCVEVDLPSCVEVDLPSCVEVDLPSCVEVDLPACVEVDLPSCVEVDLPACVEVDLASCTEPDLPSQTHDQSINVAHVLPCGTIDPTSDSSIDYGLFACQNSATTFVETRNNNEPEPQIEGAVSDKSVDYGVTDMDKLVDYGVRDMDKSVDYGVTDMVYADSQLKTDNHTTLKKRRKTQKLKKVGNISQQRLRPLRRAAESARLRICSQQVSNRIKQNYLAMTAAKQNISISPVFPKKRQQPDSVMAHHSSHIGTENTEPNYMKDSCSVDHEVESCIKNNNLKHSTPCPEKKCHIGNLTVERSPGVTPISKRKRSTVLQKNTPSYSEYPQLDSGGQATTTVCKSIVEKPKDTSDEVNINLRMVTQSTEPEMTSSATESAHHHRSSLDCKSADILDSTFSSPQEQRASGGFRNFANEFASLPDEKQESPAPNVVQEPPVPDEVQEPPVPDEVQEPPVPDEVQELPSAVGYINVVQPTECNALKDIQSEMHMTNKLSKSLTSHKKSSSLSLSKPVPMAIHESMGICARSRKKRKRKSKFCPLPIASNIGVGSKLTIAHHQDDQAHDVRRQKTSRRMVEGIDECEDSTNSSVIVKLNRIPLNSGTDNATNFTPEPLSQAGQKQEMGSYTVDENNSDTESPSVSFISQKRLPRSGGSSFQAIDMNNDTIQSFTDRETEYAASLLTGQNGSEDVITFGHCSNDATKCFTERVKQNDTHTSYLVEPNIENQCNVAANSDLASNSCCDFYDMTTVLISPSPRHAQCVDSVPETQDSPEEMERVTASTLVDKLHNDTDGSSSPHAHHEHVNPIHTKSSLVKTPGSEAGKSCYHDRDEHQDIHKEQLPVVMKDVDSSDTHSLGHCSNDATKCFTERVKQSDTHTSYLVEPNIENQCNMAANSDLASKSCCDFYDMTTVLTSQDHADDINSPSSSLNTARSQASPIKIPRHAQCVDSIPETQDSPEEMEHVTAHHKLGNLIHAKSSLVKTPSSEAGESGYRDRDEHQDIYKEQLPAVIKGVDSSDAHRLKLQPSSKEKFDISTCCDHSREMPVNPRVSFANSVMTPKSRATALVAMFDTPKPHSQTLGMRNTEEDTVMNTITSTFDSKPGVCNNPVVSAEMHESAGFDVTCSRSKSFLFVHPPAEAKSCKKRQSNTSKWDIRAFDEFDSKLRSFLLDDSHNENHRHLPSLSTTAHGAEGSGMGNKAEYSVKKNRNEKIFFSGDRIDIISRFSLVSSYNKKQRVPIRSSKSRESGTTPSYSLSMTNRKLTRRSTASSVKIYKGERRKGRCQSTGGRMETNDATRTKRRSSTHDPYDLSDSSLISNVDRQALRRQCFSHSLPHHATHSQSQAKMYITASPPNGSPLINEDDAIPLSHCDSRPNGKTMDLALSQSLGCSVSSPKAAGEVALERCVVDDKCFSEIKVEYLPPDLKSSCVPQQRSEDIHSFKQKGRQRDVDGIEAAQSIIVSKSLSEPRRTSRLPKREIKSHKDSYIRRRKKPGKLMIKGDIKYVSDMAGRTTSHLKRKLYNTDSGHKFGSDDDLSQSSMCSSNPSQSLASLCYAKRRHKSSAYRFKSK